MQTYGQATHLGFLQLTLDETKKDILAHNGKLIPVNADTYVPDAHISEILTASRSRHPHLFETVGRSAHYMSRRYIEESDVGNLFADRIRAAAKTDLAFVHAGSLRKDIPEGTLTRADILDVYPFVDDVLTFDMNGAQLREVLKQSLSFERGLLQISGFEITYDSTKPIGNRLLSVRYKGQEVQPTDTFTGAAPGFLAEGGDLYTTFAGIPVKDNVGKVSDIIVAYAKQSEAIIAPSKGRQKDVGNP